MVSAPSQTSGQGNVTSRAPCLYSVGPHYQSWGSVPWGEPLYRNEAMPSLEGSDRVHMQGGQEQGCWESPGVQGYLHPSIWKSQCGRPVVSGSSLGTTVSASALSTRGVSFPPMFARVSREALGDFMFMVA